MKTGDIYEYVNKFNMNVPSHYLTEKDYKEQKNSCNSFLEKVMEYKLELGIICMISTECIKCGKIFNYYSIPISDFLANHKKVNITIII